MEVVILERLGKMFLKQCKVGTECKEAEAYLR